MAITINSTQKPEGKSYQNIFITVNADGGDCKFSHSAPSDLSGDALQEYVDGREDFYKRELLRNMYEGADAYDSSLEDFEAWVSAGAKNVAVTKTIVHPAVKKQDVVYRQKIKIEEVALYDTDGEVIGKHITQVMEEYEVTPAQDAVAQSDAVAEVTSEVTNTEIVLVDIPWEDEVPTMVSKINEIREWMGDKDVDFLIGDSKAELLAKIPKFKESRYIQKEVIKTVIVSAATPGAVARDAVPAVMGKRLVYEDDTDNVISPAVKAAAESEEIIVVIPEQVIEKTAWVDTH